MDAKSFLLAQDEDMKKTLLKSALDDGKFGEFVAMSKILLDAPIYEGGLPSEDIDLIHATHCAETK